MATESTRHQPSGFGTIVWALFFFFIFALLILVSVRWAGKSEGYEDKRAAFRIKAHDDRAKDDHEKLTTAGWADQAKGVVRIPIADAKKIALNELKAKKPAPSNIKVEAPLPMPPAADPNAAEPPPPALPSAPQGADTIYFPVPTAAPAASTPAAASPAETPKPESK